MAVAGAKFCKDCLFAWVQVQGQYVDNFKSTRPAKYPGPRCFTCWRDEQKRRKAANHAAHVVRTYGLADGDYDRLYEIQGGTCALCRRATGATKKLAVDHDHKTGQVRGLLCGPCNKTLGLARDDPAYFMRAARYLHDPPARKL